MSRQLLVDGHSLLFRAYHALPPLTNREGTPTGALHGFAGMLLKMLAERSPHRVVVVFDAPKPTFRHQIYEQYKGTRSETPEEFRQQVPLVERLLDFLEVPRVAAPGYEADDVLGTLARMGVERGYDTEIVTGDRDLLQMIGPSITVYLTTRAGISAWEAMDTEKTVAKLGVRPDQVPDLKGLMGDSSDNIRGVTGIGEKSARALLQQYGSLDEIYAHLDEIDNPRWVQALRSQRETALQSRYLATIVANVPVAWPHANEPYQIVPTPALEEFLDAMDMQSIQRRIRQFSEGTTVPTNVQTAPSESGRADAWSPPTVREMPPEQFRVADLDVVIVAATDSNEWLMFSGDRVTRWRGAWPRARFAGWGTKELLRTLGDQAEGVSFVEDGEIQAYLLDSEAKAYSLDQVADRLGLEVGQDPQRRILVLAELLSRQTRRLEALGLTRLYREVEMPLVPVLAAMESTGIRVDVNQLRSLGQECEALLRTLETEIYALAKEPFNIQSPRQLADVLFSRLQLPSGKRTKTGYSTDADTLEKLRNQHPIVEKILEFRQLSKIKGTYVDGIVDLVDEAETLHTTFHQTGTATGRLSSSNPNLQNIPVREPMGRRVRGVFKPSPGNILVAADYSQIELRMLAHLSGDERLIQAFREGEDIHRRTASEMFNIPWAEVDSTWRNRAKAINFGIIYGISGFGLARDAGIAQHEAEDYIRRYYARYPTLKAYFDNVLTNARAHGLVTTILGRRRMLPDILHKNRTRRQIAERMAINTVIQGSAADLIKTAMVAIWREMRSRRRWESRLTLQVHDELIWDAVPSEEQDLMAMARLHMSSVLSLSVPLVVECKHGPNWEQMSPVVGEDSHA